MVSKKRLDYGFNGFRSPIVPRAPRSIRRRSPEKDLEDSNMCPFELLAAVAGRLLKESESSSSSNAAEGKLHPGISRGENDKGSPANDSFLKSKSHDQGSCAESAFVPEYSVQERNLLSNFKAENDSVLEHTSEFASSDLLNEVDCNIVLGICEDKAKVESELETQSEDDKKQIGELTLAHTSTKKDPNSECVNKTNVLINYESSVQPSLYRDPLPSAFIRKQWDNVKLGIRDDDENSSFRCNKTSTRIRPFRPQARTAHRRQRKMMTSRYWKAASKMKDCELYKTNNGMRTFYRYRKNIYERERCHQAPTKKRKLCDDRFGVSYDQSASSDSVSNLPACGGSATVQGHQRPKDPHVKFSIKSFRVPELYIEVPETATVGSLKRTVLEAVTAILGGGIRVGMALQGKKVRDDSRTLQQAGISRSNTLDTLGFTLEPSFAHVSPCSTPNKQHPLVFQCDADQSLPRSPGTPMIDSGISNASIETTFVLPKLNEEIDIKNIISSSPKCALTTHGMNFTDTKALVPLPSSMNADPLAVVPMNAKPKRSELSQRRTRRPFSVGEVESLVEAVEKLGTGRWRDVKMRAFENAEHRTYVDLKDKWKTLVHTASIAPQQRRGEPVPQDLLDRVLAAHSYWTQNQPKQQAKLPIEPLKIADVCEEMMIVGA